MSKISLALADWWTEPEANNVIDTSVKYEGTGSLKQTSPEDTWTHAVCLHPDAVGVVDGKMEIYLRRSIEKAWFHITFRNVFDPGSPTPVTNCYRLLLRCFPSVSSPNFYLYLFRDDTQVDYTSYGDYMAWQTGQWCKLIIEWKTTPDGKLRVDWYQENPGADYYGTLIDPENWYTDPTNLRIGLHSYNVVADNTIHWDYLVLYKYFKI